MMMRNILLTGSILSIALPAFASDKNLIILDWAGWDIPGIYAAYKEKHGDGPTYSFYANDDEAFQKASSGFRADLAHPCSPSVGRYRDAGLIEPWDTGKLPDFANIPAHFFGSPILKDDQGVWFIPTDYAYTAIAYNEKEVPVADVASLQVFKDPKYAGRVSLPNSADDTWALAFLATGVTTWDNVTDEQFQAAADWLRAVHPNVRAYWSDPSEMAQLMATNEVLIAWSWNDGVAALQKEKFPVGFQRTPKEGVSTWFCGFVNFKDGPGEESRAYDYMNSVLSPTSAEPLMDVLGYALSNDAAMKTVPEDKLKAHFLDPITGTIFAQTPVGPEMRNKMIEEFEAIKAGF